MVDPVALTAELVRRPSITPDDAGCFDILEAVLTPLGFQCERVVFASDGAAPVVNLWAKHGRGRPHIGFCGHVDVVPPGDRASWTKDPWGAVIEEGRLYGRGAADMKSGVAAFVAATAAVLEERPDIEGDAEGAISFLITADEEGPSVNGIARLIPWLESRGERMDACLVGEPTSLTRVGEVVKVGRRGALTARLEVLGVQGHTAYPHRADNAAHRLVRMLGELIAEPLDDGNANFPPTTLQVATIDVGNPATNIIPGRATTVIDVRFGELQTAASVEAWIRARLDRIAGEYRLVCKTSGEAFRTESGALIELMREAVRDVTGEVPVLDTGGGTSDARFIYRHCSVVELGLVGATMHKADESVSLADVHQLTRIYEAFLRRWFHA